MTSVYCIDRMVNEIQFKCVGQAHLTQKEDKD